jgi:methylase of polypeptide subunit release factors
MQHAMMTLLLGEKLYWSPLSDDIQKALDLGTGTGIWAIEFSDLFPSCEVSSDSSQDIWETSNCE